MTDIPVPTPSPLERARQRLDRAVARLEASVDHAMGGDREVSDALDAVRQENAALKEVAETAARRLDVAIDRLRTALDD